MVKWTIPNPVDEQGNELTPEQVEQMALEPVWVSVPLIGRGTFYIGADFEQVERAQDHSYQIAKSRIVRSWQKPAARLNKNSKFTNLKPGEVPDLNEDEIEDGMVAYDTILGTAMDIYDSALQLVCNSDPSIPSVIVASNVPGMPSIEDRAALYEWFEKGTPTAQAALHALVMAYDPTGLTAHVNSPRAVQAATLPPSDTAIPSTTTEESIPENSTTDASPSPSVGATELAGESSATVTETPSSINSPLPSTATEKTPDETDFAPDGLPISESKSAMDEAQPASDGNA